MLFVVGIKYERSSHQSSLIVKFRLLEKKEKEKNKNHKWFFGISYIRLQNPCIFFGSLYRVSFLVVSYISDSVFIFMSWTWNFSFELSTTQYKRDASEFDTLVMFTWSFNFKVTGTVTVFPLYKYL